MFIYINVYINVRVKNTLCLVTDMPCASETLMLLSLKFGI